MTISSTNHKIYTVENEKYSVCGEEVTLDYDEEVEAGDIVQLINTTVNVPAGRTLTNNGTIVVEQGSVFNICGTYVGSLASIINNGGTVNFNCEEAEEATPSFVAISDNPNTFDSIQNTINTFILGMFTLTTTSISYPLIRRSRR